MAGSAPACRTTTSSTRRARARVVIAEINPDAPWTFGAEWPADIVPHRRIAATRPPLELPAAKPDDVSRRIAEHAASLDSGRQHAAVRHRQNSGCDPVLAVACSRPRHSLRSHQRRGGGSHRMRRGDQCRQGHRSRRHHRQPVDRHPATLSICASEQGGLGAAGVLHPCPAGSGRESTGWWRSIRRWKSASTAASTPRR